MSKSFNIFNTQVSASTIDNSTMIPMFNAINLNDTPIGSLSGIISGDQLTWNGSDWSGSNSNISLTGTTGYKGYTGPSGPTGYIGYIGYTGYVGPTGQNGYSIAFYEYIYNITQSDPADSGQIRFSNPTATLGTSNTSWINATTSLGQDIKNLVFEKIPTGTTLRVQEKANASIFADFIINSVIYVSMGDSYTLNITPSQNQGLFTGESFVLVGVYALPGATGPTGPVGPVGPIGFTGPIGPVYKEYCYAYSITDQNNISIDTNLNFLQSSSIKNNIIFDGTVFTLNENDRYLINFNPFVTYDLPYSNSEITVNLYSFDNKIQNLTAIALNTKCQYPQQFSQIFVPSITQGYKFRTGSTRTGTGNINVLGVSNSPNAGTSFSIVKLN
jgi:hypothetical protein